MSFFDWLPSLFGGAASAYGQHSANKANRYIADSTNFTNAQMAREAMSFSERMANTAHQRELADLKAAGINPMLAANLGGSSSPPGASIPAVTGAPQQNELSGASSAVTSAMDAARLRADLANLRETNAKIKSDTALNFALRKSAIEDSRVKAATALNARINAENMRMAQAGHRQEEKIDKSKFGRAMRWLGRMNPFSSISSSAKNVMSLVK